MSVWRQTGEEPEALRDAVQLPELTTYLWNWFCEMHLQRESGGMGPGRITSQTMIDWSWETGNTLDLWERKAIRAIDNVWFKTRPKK